MDWKLKDAKNRLSEIVGRALAEGPQRVLHRDGVVVVLSEEEYERLAGSRLSFKDFLLSAPAMDDLDLDRAKEPMRDVQM